MYAKENVTYPFGHGLSYTTFEYSDLTVTQKDQQVTTVVQVTNTGDMDGDEVVQLYVSNLDSKVEQPIRQLKAFKRVSVPAGKTVQVELTFSSSDLGWWSEKKQAYTVDHGRYRIGVGRSSSDMVCEQIIKL